MKIVPLISLALLISITFSSCKRTRVCYCKSIYVDPFPIPVYGTKKVARAKCKVYETNGELGYNPDQGCDIVN